MKKIFYAHSTHRESINNMYFKISEHFDNNEKIQILDVDKSIKNNSIFLNVIEENLNSADILICDITPDFIPFEHIIKKSYDMTPCINSNVMYELGYFSHKHNNKNIILIVDNEFGDKIQSLLRGHYIIKYSSIDESDYIIDRLLDFVNSL
jgi:predicted nucleotide-binding protein